MASKMLDSSTYSWIYLSVLGNRTSSSLGAIFNSDRFFLSAHRKSDHKIAREKDNGILLQPDSNWLHHEIGCSPVSYIRDVSNMAAPNIALNIRIARPSDAKLVARLGRREVGPGDYLLRIWP